MLNVLADFNNHKKLLNFFRFLNKSFKSKLLFATVTALVIVFVGVTGNTHEVSAVTKTSTLSPGDQARSYAYYKALRECFSLNIYNNIDNRNPFIDKASFSQIDAINLDWFNNTYLLSVRPVAVNVGVINDTRADNSGDQNCGDSEGRAWINKALTLWQVDVPDFLCSLGFTRDQKNGISCNDTTENSINDFHANSGTADLLDDFWLSQKSFKNKGLGNTNTGPQGIAEGEYRLYLDSFLTRCRPSNTGTTYKIKVFNTANSATTSDKSYGAPSVDRGTGYVVDVYQGFRKTCGELVNLINADTDRAVKNYALWAANNDATLDRPTGATIGCSVSNTTGCPGVTSSWIVCPAFNFLAGVTDAIYGIIERLLVTDLKIASMDGPTYNAWSVIRTLANVGFVIVFLIIIFSQLTSIGVSNYGVKKLLPRIIVAAILVNVSFFVAQIAVDLSNILGGSLKTLLTNINIGGASNNPLDTGTAFTDIALSIFAAQAGVGVVVAGAAAAYFGGVALLIPILLAAVLAVIITVFILIARQALIILLIIISPLAFLAMLLPNTEQYFKQWRKIFVGLLLVYPLIAVLFGVSNLASNILLRSFATTGNDANLGQLVGLAVLVLPLFIVPSLLKGSLNAIPAIGNFATKMQNRANGLMGKESKQGFAKSTFGRSAAIRRQAKDNYRAGKFAEGASKRGSIASFLAKEPGILPSQRAANRAVERSAIATSEKADEGEVTAAESLLRAQNTNPSKLINVAGQEFRDAVAKGDSVRARAAQNVLLNSGGRGIAELHESVKAAFPDAASKNSPVGQSVRSALNRAGLKSKNNALASWAYDDNDIAGSTASTSTYAGLSDVELGGHSLDNLKAARRSIDEDGNVVSVLDADRAARILDNDMVSGGMGEGERKYLESFATIKPASPVIVPIPPTAPPAAPPAPPAPSPPSPPPKSPKPPQSPTPPGNFLG